MEGSPYAPATGILVGRDTSQGSSQAGTLNIYSTEVFVQSGDGHITPIRSIFWLYLNKLAWES